MYRPRGGKEGQSIVGPPCSRTTGKGVPTARARRGSIARAPKRHIVILSMRYEIPGFGRERLVLTLRTEITYISVRSTPRLDRFQCFYFFLIVDA